MIKKNIFLVCYGAGHINIIEPIVDQLIKNNNYNIKLLALTNGYLKVKNKYNKDILKSVSDYLFLFDENIDSIFKNGMKIFEENYNTSAGLSKLEVLSYLGLSYSELIENLGKTKAINEYKRIGRQSFHPVKTIKKILDYENIDLLITTNSPRFESASLIAAKELNINSIQFVDLFGEDLMEQNATYTMVMNALVKDNLINKGFNADYIFPVGQPAIENTVKKVLEINNNQLYTEMNISFDKKKKNLIYFSQPPIKFDKSKNSIGTIPYDKINPNVFKILDDLKYKYNIYIRLHPSENIEEYNKYFEKYPHIIYLNNKLNLYQTISISDIVITPYSTVSIEAISCNKIVFTYKADLSESYPIEYLMKEPFIYSNSFNELKSKLLQLEIDDYKNYFEKNYFLKNNFFQNFNQFLSKYVLVG